MKRQLFGVRRPGAALAGAGEAFNHSKSDKSVGPKRCQASALQRVGASGIGNSKVYRTLKIKLTILLKSFACTPNDGPYLPALMHAVPE